MDLLICPNRAEWDHGIFVHNPGATAELFIEERIIIFQRFHFCQVQGKHACIIEHIQCKEMFAECPKG